MKWRKLDIDPRTISESTVVKAQLPAINGKVQEMTTEGGMKYLMPQIEAIHAGSTRNSTIYESDKLKGHAELKSGAFSWTQPYPKPVIYNHDVETEASGRVHSAHYTEYTVAGRPGLIVVPKITHPKAIQDVLDGRLLTVSIGATTDSAVCTICGTDIIHEGFCGHMKGETYDGQHCEWKCGNLWFDELSWVNVPADPDAMIVNQGTVFQPTASTSESVITVTQSQQPDCNCHTTTKEGNEDNMDLEKQIEELQAEVAGLKEANATLETEKTTLEEAKSKAEADLATAQTSLEEKTTELEEVNTKLTEAKSELEATQTELAESKEANTGLVESNTALADEVRESKVNHLVDLRVTLGKESDREAAVAKFKERSLESLNDSISDILTEGARVLTPVQTAPARTVEHVDHPGATQVATTTAPVAEGLTSEDVIINMLRGKRK